MNNIVSLFHHAPIIQKRAKQLKNENIQASMNMKKCLDQRQGTCSSPLSFIFQYSLKKYGTSAMNRKKKNALKPFIGISPFMCIKVVSKYCLRSMKGVEM